MSTVKPKAIINAPSTVQVNTLVTLDGTQSTGATKYHWIQKKGKKVKIIDAFKATANFTPTVKGDIQIKLKVDGPTGTGRAFVTITVTDVAPPTCQPHAHWDGTKCVCDSGFHDDGAGNCVPDIVHTCDDPNAHWDGTACVCNSGYHDENGVCVPDPTGDVLYDSHRDSKLHDGKVRTVQKEGSITPNGLGLECHASGNPRIVVNDDGTFSLLGDGGFPRFYAYVLNYNSTLEIECAFWNDGGQDLSLKIRSRHNEGGACDNRFGGYGVAVDRNGWDAKREVCHNIHDESQSGSLPEKPVTKQYFKIEFTVKDDGNGVRQIAKINGKQFMNKFDSSPKPYMVDQASFAKQSYFWVRSNNSSHTEVRIKSLRVLKA